MVWKKYFVIVSPKINLIKKYGLWKCEDNEAFQKENKVIIKDGKIINGVFDKSLLGTKARRIVHIIYNDYGHLITKNF